MKPQEIKEKLSTIVANLDKENFIYDFLMAFGVSKNAVTRLRKGDSNLSKKEGELLYKNKIFFKEEIAENLFHIVDEAAKDDKILKHNPRFIVVTDYRSFVATDVKLKVNRRFSFAELPEQIDFFRSLTGAEIYKITTNDEADRNAAYQLGQLYDILVNDNQEWVAQGSHHLNMFLSRLLFCFFAEDTGIFAEKSIFTETLVNNTKADGSDVDEFLNILFKKLNSKTGDFPEHLNSFPYVNGGLFKDEIICPKFSKKARNILVESGELNWSEINPDIFGSMIQAVADPEQRSNLGMHYTSVENILKLIKPLFLDELEEEFDKNMENAKGLRKLIDRISKIKFFDPACGSGNFLIITYKEIRNLEIRIIQQIIGLEKANLFGGQSFVSNIRLSQFYGIEIKDFAHEMAILSLWLAEHQMNLYFDEKLEGFGKSEPILPLKQAGNIVAGNAARQNWEDVCPKNEGDEIYIIGNPPYLGSNMHSDEQRDEMKFIFNVESLDRLDYIGIWFMLGAIYIQNSLAKCAFVTTNSITQGVQVPFLWTKIFEKKVFIQFAVKSFKWENNAKGNAGVSVAIIGLSSKPSDKLYLYDGNIAEPVKYISPYLIKNIETIVRPASQPKLGFPNLVMGNKPADNGNLILNQEEVNTLIEEYPQSKKFIKKYISADDYINGNFRYCLWINDSEEEKAKAIPAIKKRTDNLFKFRSESKAKSTRDFATKDYRFRQICYKPTDGIVIPRVSSERREYIPLAYIDENIIVSDATNIIYDAQPWLFGILHSKMHMVWVDAVGGKLETRYRYSAKLCYNTFPFPEITEKQKLTINEYVFAILDERAKFSEKTMAWLYNPETMPKDLRQAHQNLDKAIEEIYRLGNPFTSDAERLEHLFKRYDEMTKRDTLFAKQKKTRKKKSDLS